VKNMKKEEEQTVEKKEEHIKDEKELIKEEKERELTKAKEQEALIQQRWKEDIQKGDIIQRPAYFEMQHYINMVFKRQSTGVAITSRGGTGKTYTTLNILEKNGVDYAYIDSYSTPTAFYIWLFKNKDKIKVIDDVSKLLESEKFSPFLKAVLWGVGGDNCRKVCYNSTKNLDDPEVGIVPNEFEETGGCIILANKVNENNLHVDAILSRINYIRLEINNEEMLKNMEFVANKPYRKLIQEERTEVYDYLKEHFRNSVDLNLRTLIKAFNFYEYAKSQESNEGKKKELWQRLVLKMIKQDDSVAIMEQIMSNPNLPTEKEKMEEFERMTGRKGRATFYRYKSKVQADIGKSA